MSSVKYTYGNRFFFKAPFVLLVLRILSPQRVGAFRSLFLRQRKGKIFLNPRKG